MNHIQESERNYQYKTNYMAKFLSEKSKNIINKINNKNMKNLILTLMLPMLSFAQTYYDSALNFQNTVRSYYDITPLSYSNDLSIAAQEWADYMATTDSFTVSSDNYGENIFYINKSYVFENGKDVLLEASLNWVLDSDDNSTYDQIIYPDATSIGFGISENNESIYVVAKYNKLYK
jgi:hypothetical protein